jgi:hypothetical protein
MLLGGPIGGALLGMLGGGVWGARDTGVPTRLRELGESLAPGGALLCALVKAGDAALVREGSQPAARSPTPTRPRSVAAPVEQVRDPASGNGARTPAAGTRASPRRPGAQSSRRASAAP